MPLEALFCQSSPLSSPLKLHTFRNTQTQSASHARTKHLPIVCAAMRSAARGNVETLYDLLELSPDVGMADIKQAYRQMAKKYHPDVRPSHQAEESARRFIEIQQAYETLSDPRTRAVYDHAVAMGRRSAATGRCMQSYDMENQFSHWKSQWESQLSDLRRRSSMKAGKADSWSARVRRENGFCEAST